MDNTVGIFCQNKNEKSEQSFVNFPITASRLSKSFETFADFAKSIYEDSFLFLRCVD